MKQKMRDTPARAAMKLLCTVLGIVLAVLLGTSVLFQYVLGSINYVDSGVSGNPLSVFSPISDIHLDAQKDKIGGTGSGIVNILLIGQDRREGETQARSDSMILCTFNKKTKKITMTSFLRDLYVPIPGHHDNRINAAYSTGGMALLNDTLEQNFDLHIDGNVEVDFSQFSDIVDLLGGVEIELRQDEADVINQETGSTLGPGVQTLNGPQALAYSRIRRLDRDGDFSRTNRQRKVMAALLDAYRGIKLTELVPLLRELLPMITTDMNSGQILLLAMEILPSLSGAQIVSQHIPAEGTYSDQNIDGMAVLVADMDAARQMLRQTLLEN